MVGLHASLTLRSVPDETNMIGWSCRETYDGNPDLHLRREPRVLFELDAGETPQVAAHRRKGSVSVDDMQASLTPFTAQSG